jgi:hypothetical protein
MKYLQNTLKIKDNKESTFYLYHMYNSTTMKYQGRWYNMHFQPTSKNLLEKRKSLLTRMTFTDEATFKTYPVEIEIFFSESGWKKITKLMTPPAINLLEEPRLMPNPSTLLAPKGSTESQRSR